MLYNKCFRCVCLKVFSYLYYNCVYASEKKTKMQIWRLSDQFLAVLRTREWAMATNLHTITIFTGLPSDIKSIIEMNT